MHFVPYTFIGLLGLSGLASSSAIDAVFDIKKGTDKGGCDNYRKGSPNADLDGYFDEAKDVIATAAAAFQNYKTDEMVQKVAKSFFGINPNDARDGTKTDEDAKLLTHVQGWFTDLQKFANGGGPKLPLYCNSDWLEVTTKVYSSKGRENPKLSVADDQAYGKSVPKLKTGEWVAFWSADLNQYYFGPPYKTNPPTYCTDKNNIAVTTEMSTTAKTTTLTFCPSGFFKKPKTAERINIAQSDIGILLQSLEAKSLTIVHELVHAVEGPDNTPDIIAWGPKASIKKTINGKANPAWPGNTDDFVEDPNKAEVYSASQAILTALKTNPRQPTESNPENFSWAALALYLAEKGAKMDYSTGRARPMGKPLEGPKPPLKRNADDSENESDVLVFVERNFVA